MGPPDTEERILRCLAVSPHSLAELVHGTNLRVKLIAPAIRSLVAGGQVVKIEGRTDDGRAIYCLPDYVEACEKRDHSDVRLARDYGDYYDSPGWTADV